MDRLNSPEESHPQIEQEKESIDPPYDPESNRSNEDTHPPRSPSRLDFNRTVLSTTASDAASDLEAVQWSRSLFQNVGISDLKSSSIKPQLPAQEDIMDSLGSSSTDVANSVLAPTSSEGSAIEFPSSAPPEDSARSPVVARKSPSVSRLCFPFVTTPSPHRNKPPPSPPPPRTRHKYSCFPSLMSPISATRPSPKRQRHRSSQHGYSRMALQHVKWFWSLREEDREGTEQSVSQENGIDSSTQVHPSADHPLRIDPMRQTEPPITVHPRRGDISALRDPYCTHIDRCFIGLPTWTIGKAIWMHDLHMANAKRNATIQDASDAGSENDDDESESDFEASVSTHFSDDSDTTLVDSENECDQPNLGTSIASPSPKGNTKFDKIQDNGDRSLMDGVATHSSSPLLSGQLASWSRGMNDVNSKSRNADHLKPAWATNWYRRWEFLLVLTRQDKDRLHGIFGGAAPPLDIGPPSPSFFNDTSGSDGFVPGSSDSIALPLNIGPPSTPDDTSGPYGFAIGSSFNKDSDNDAWIARLEAY